MKKLTWSQVVRQNTGSHFLDSGMENGRHWQQPLPTKPVNLEFYERDGKIIEVSGAISTAAFLEATTEIDQKLTRWLRKKSGHALLSEHAELLADHLGVEVISKADNTYNQENDLDQNFQYILVGSNKNWMDDIDSCWAIVSTHNGADIRGGYSDPVVCKMIDVEGINFFDFCVSVRLEGIGDFEGCDLEEANEKLEIGYSGHPLEQLRKMVSSYRSVDVESGEFVAELVTGETVKGKFYHNCGL
jgi:hypothetical protein